MQPLTLVRDLKTVWINVVGAEFSAAIGACSVDLECRFPGEIVEAPLLACRKRHNALRMLLEERDDLLAAWMEDPVLLLVVAVRPPV